LASFKKSGTTSVSVTPPIDIAPTVVIPQAPIVTAPITVTSVVAEPTVAPVVEEAVLESLETILMDTSVSVSVPVITEPAATEEVLETPKAVTPEPVATTPTSSEFFPNLGFENNNLFKDIIEMGSFEKEKEVTPEVSTPVETVSQNISNSKVDTLTEITPVEMEKTVENTNIPAVAKVIETEKEVPQVENIQPPALATDQPPAPVNQTPPEYVDTIAKDLSLKRKGGLSELFDKKKNVFIGISATMIV
jgi:hypothetical protein